MCIYISFFFHHCICFSYFLTLAFVSKISFIRHSASVSRTLVHQRKTRYNTRKQSNNWQRKCRKCVFVCARLRLLFACSTVIQHRTKWDAIHQFSTIFTEYSRPDFLTTLEIYHLINFMASYFSRLSSRCLVHNKNNFCVFSKCNVMPSPQLYSLKSTQNISNLMFCVLWDSMFSFANTTKKYTQQRPFVK